MIWQLMAALLDGNNRRMAEPKIPSNLPQIAQILFMYNGVSWTARLCTVV